MAQFHVYRLPDGQLVLDLQTDLIDTGSRVVAPLLPVTAVLKPLTRLEPEFDIGGERVALHTAEMAAIPSALLSADPVADLTSEDYAIRGALDMVFSGF
ncbi:plasmid maintenance protein CcdB [Loktanella sp. IMCC34160]|uniref:CcdB family protein n=1 Tax=Loktanella sp. IMCC34160 TaxID=2510646 RepID=UPI00101C8D1D|nr:CcdB family protein [Loktanella sp. IMCC34160]RYG89962.1 plasmid maintenance protein CcdB [Loktanella sp. IMCC34160]